MGKRKRGQAVHGWLVLDKPYDMTSTQAVGKVRWLFDAQKAGHAGTLDPLATGILPIALGDATKTVPFIVDASKEYVFTVQFGAQTTTDDAEGEVIAQGDTADLTTGAIEALLGDYIGDVEQVPPQFSAIKVNGERAYDMARDGEEVVLKSRTVSIDSFALTNLDAETGQATFHVGCGKGTYVRALARDLGKALGCFGHVCALRRTRVGPFDEASATDVADIACETPAERGPDEARMAHLKPVGSALVDVPAVRVSGPEVSNLRRGRAIIIRGQELHDEGETVRAVGPGGSLIALGEVGQGQLHPRKVFA